MSVAPQSFCGIPLEEEEWIEIESRASRAGIVILWISAPSVLLFVFLTVYLPRIIRRLFQKTFRTWLFGLLGLDRIGGESGGEVLDDASRVLRAPALVLSVLAILLLLIAWCAVCTYITRRNFQYNLALTNFRVIGISAGKVLDASVNSIVNVFLEQPLLGKLLNYGTVTVYTRQKSISFYHVQNPEKIYGSLMQYAEKN